MTLGVVFIRRVPNRENRRELVFASDSRLSWGQRLDDGCKIFRLPRSDCLLGFAGDTAYAYPLALQMIAGVEMFPRSMDRRFPLAAAKGQMLRVFNQLYGSIHSLPTGQKFPHPAEPEVQFVFGGYSWHDERFRIWHVRLDQRSQKFQVHRRRRFCFFGDEEAVNAATGRTMERISRDGSQPDAIDMEPFEILREIIRGREWSTIGGAPQLAKVYRHMQVQFFSTLWEHKGRKIPHAFGRPILPPETTSWPFFDPDTLDFNAESSFELTVDEAKEDDDLHEID